MLNKDKFIEEVKNTDWDFITNYIDVNGSYNNFIDLILNSLDRHCPYESKIIKIKKLKKPWINKALIKACKKKNLLYKSFLSKKTVESDVNINNIRIRWHLSWEKLKKIIMMSSYVKVNQILKKLRVQ